MCIGCSASDNFVVVVVVTLQTRNDKAPIRPVALSRVTPPLPSTPPASSGGDAALVQTLLSRMDENQEEMKLLREQFVLQSQQISQQKEEKAVLQHKLQELQGSLSLSAPSSIALNQPATGLPSCVDSDLTQASAELTPLSALLLSELFRANNRHEDDMRRREDEMRRREERVAQAGHMNGNALYDFLKRTAAKGGR